MRALRAAALMMREAYSSIAKSARHAADARTMPVARYDVAIAALPPYACRQICYVFAVMMPRLTPCHFAADT